MLLDATGPWRLEFTEARERRGFARPHGRVAGSEVPRTLLSDNFTLAKSF
jgi:hypothetical protein